MDDPETMKSAFDQAAQDRLESKRKSLYKTVSLSPSIPSCLDSQCGGGDSGRQFSMSSEFGSINGFREAELQHVSKQLMENNLLEGHNLTRMKANRNLNAPP
jgi:hypothetical protein